MEWTIVVPTHRRQIKEPVLNFILGTLFLTACCKNNLVLFLYLNLQLIHLLFTEASVQGSFLYPTENQWQVLQNDL